MDDILHVALNGLCDVGVELSPGGRLCDLEYVDDAVCLFESNENVQIALDRLREAAHSYGICFAPSKYKTMDCPLVNQHQILVLNCSYCPFNTLVLSNLLHHFRAAHPSAACLFALYQCQNCHIISTSCSLLTEHSSLIHPDKEISVSCIYQNCSGAPILNDSMYECLLCSFKSKETKNLTLHYFAFHGIRNVAPSVGLLSGMEYSTGHHNKTRPHMKSGFAVDGQHQSHSFIDLSADENDNCLDRKNDLNGSSNKDRPGENNQIHSKRSLDLLPFKCNNCGNAYSKRKYFTEHVFSCSKSLQLTCPCGRVCKWRSNFYAHRKSCAVYKQLVAAGSHSIGLRRRGPKSPTQTSAQSEMSTFCPNDPLIAVTSNSGDLNTSTSNLQTDHFASLVPITSATTSTPVNVTNNSSKADSIVPVTSVNFVSGSYFVPANHSEEQRDISPLSTETIPPDRSVFGHTTVSPASIINALNQKAANLTCLTAAPQTSSIGPSHYESNHANLYASRGATNEFINLLLPKQEAIAAATASSSSETSYSSIVFPGM